MLSVLTAAFVGANPDRPLAAAAAAVCAMGLCGETAAARLTGEEGTGTLRMYLMDAVSNLTGEQLDQGANDELYC
jgi:hydroxyethylthiazole kinase